MPAVTPNHRTDIPLYTGSARFTEVESGGAGAIVLNTRTERSGRECESFVEGTLRQQGPWDSMLRF